jgi:hypothetical protein
MKVSIQQLYTIFKNTIVFVNLIKILTSIFG